MKTKTLIIAFLIVSLLGAFTLKAHSQHIQLQQRPNINSIQRITPTDEQWKSDTTIAAKNELIADETTLTYTKTGAKIISFSEAAFKAISLKWGEEFKSIRIDYKTDKKYGKYKQYTICLSTELAKNIKQWAKKNL